MFSQSILTPQAPTEMVMPANLQMIMLAITACLGVLVVGVAIWESRRRRDLVAIYTLIGAMLAIVYEPIGDILGMAYYPEVQQISWIESFDRQIPLFIALIYFCYFPPFILYFLRLRQRGIRIRQWWGLWLGTVVATFAFEPIPVHAGLWAYYGAQPFVVLKFPLYWAFLNATFVFGTAMGVHFIVDYFGGRKNWLIIPALPMFLYFFHGAPSLPVATMLSATDNLWWTSLGGGLTIGLCVLIAWVGAQVHCFDSAQQRRKAA